MAVKDGLPSTDFSRMNREYIKAKIEEAGGGSGGGLPDITEADEGKFLGVVSGEAAWATAGGGGGGGVLVCTVTPIPDDPNNNVILDKTWAEIYTATSSGVPVIVFEDASASPDIINLFDLVTSVEKNSDTAYLVQCGMSDTVYSSATENGYPQTTNS